MSQVTRSLPAPTLAGCSPWSGNPGRAMTFSYIKWQACRSSWPFSPHKIQTEVPTAAPRPGSASAKDSAPLGGLS